MEVQLNGLEYSIGTPKKCSLIDVNTSIIHQVRWS